MNGVVPRTSPSTNTLNSFLISSNSANCSGCSVTSSCCSSITSSTSISEGLGTVGSMPNWRQKFIPKTICRLSEGAIKVVTNFVAPLNVMGRWTYPETSSRSPPAEKSFVSEPNSRRFSFLSRWSAPAPSIET
uniref:(northern house mosquito) hypothetical protein n=1 Tax=Culex pipiens TaxID=7175 RepID=A0A8D8P4Z2_CULPI